MRGWTVAAVLTALVVGIVIGLLIDHSDLLLEDQAIAVSGLTFA